VLEGPASAGPFFTPDAFLRRARRSSDLDPGVLSAAVEAPMLPQEAR